MRTRFFRLKTGNSVESCKMVTNFRFYRRQGIFD